MKLTNIIKKNIKLLVRSKASAFIILVGPLLVILLISLIFSGQQGYDLSVGYYYPEKSELTQAFIDSLEKSDYNARRFSSEQECVKKIEQGVIHTCIAFPPDFEPGNEQSNDLRFLVDYSRMNLVYKIIDSVSEVLELESQELSYDLTQVLLSKINLTLRDLDQDLELINQAGPDLTLLLSNLQQASSGVDSMELESEEVGLASLNSSVNELNLSMKQGFVLAGSLLNQTDEIIDDLEDYENVSDIREEFDELSLDFSSAKNASVQDMERLISRISSLSGSFSELEQRLGQARELRQGVLQQINNAKSNLAAVQSSFDQLKQSLESTKQSLEGIQVTRAEAIVSPVNTRIEPVVAEEDKSVFTFPFLLLLVIMFVALLLSSTMIIFEKNSKALFRNIITPTHSSLFVIATFLTSFIIILLQTAIIMGLASYFLAIPLFKNAILTLVIVLLSISFFILLGMAVGYLLSTQEGAVMVSIILGSLFLFASNLVMPLESLAPVFSGIIKYNPFVMLSELLRKSLLFNLSFSDASSPLLIILAAGAVIFILIIVLHSLFSIKRVRQPRLDHKGVQDEIEKLGSGVKPEAHKQSFAPEINAADKLELAKQLSDMTRAEFEHNFNKRENRIADYAEKELNEKKLALKLRRAKDKKELIKALVEDIRKEQKKLKKKKQARK